MIKTENVTINGKEFLRTYSDNGLMIERDGDLYCEAFDPFGSERTYTETEYTPEKWYEIIEAEAEEAFSVKEE